MIPLSACGIEISATMTEVESRKEKIGPSSARESCGKVHQTTTDFHPRCESDVTRKASESGNGGAPMCASR